MLKARDIMKKEFATVSENTDVHKICGVMIKNKVSGLPVVDFDKRLVGFVSERDIITAISNFRDLQKKKAKDIMTKKVISIKEDALSEHVSKIFTERPIRCIPVTKKGAIVGIISREEVISRLLGQYY